MKKILVNGVVVASSYDEVKHAMLTQCGPAFGSSYRSRALFLCDCGMYCTPRIADVRRGKIVSCGCRRELNRMHASKTHGMSKTPVHNCWRAMCERCNNPRNPKYAYYGRRGIKIFSEWLGRGGFEAWYSYIGPMPKEGMTQERIDPNGNYEPGNVKWADRKEQANNRRKRATDATIEVNGVSMRYSEWELTCGIRAGAIRERIRRGWTPERAISTPVKHK